MAEVRTAEVKMPALGADMVEATLLEWHVGVGDLVHRGDILATVDTAKSALDVEALQEGRIGALLINPGTTVSVGTVIATMADSVPEVPTMAPSTNERPASSPLARRRAAELGIDLADVQPSRPGGFIGVHDVEQSRPVVPAAVPEPSEQSDLLDARLAMNEGLRAVTASLMSRSKREIPHYYLQSTVDIETTLVRLEERNASLPIGERILPAALILRAIARATRIVPEVNGRFDQGFHPAAEVHLGLAVALHDGGLIAPAIHDADRLDLPTMMAKMSDLVRRARAGRLRASEMTDSTITATMLGDQGVEVVHGVIYPPQVALVGVGCILSRPWAVDGMLGIRRTVTITLAADHRVSDGHRGSQFLQAIATALVEGVDA